ncbi:MAG: hypothetical protein K0R62_2537 [Nonomuraea muscovyensis]|nr:hypothetical protein [Nonomuraea muscovyensis]
MTPDQGAAISGTGTHRTGPAGESWAAQHALPPAIARPVLIVAVFLPLSGRRRRRLDR